MEEIRSQLLEKEKVSDTEVKLREKTQKKAGLLSQKLRHEEKSRQKLLQMKSNLESEVQNRRRSRKLLQGELDQWKAKVRSKIIKKINK